MNKAKWKTKNKDPSRGLFLVMFLVIWEKSQKTNLSLILKQNSEVFYSIPIQRMWKQGLRETITFPNLISTKGEFKPSPNLAQRLSFLICLFLPQQHILEYKRKKKKKLKLWRILVRKYKIKKKTINHKGKENISTRAREGEALGNKAHVCSDGICKTTCPEIPLNVCSENNVI